MKTEHSYRPPTYAAELSPELVHYFDGKHLRERIGEAIRLTTVDEDGWPHAAMLSVGEILAIDQHHMRFVIHPHSMTTKNIERTGHVVMNVAHQGGMWEIRLSTKRAGDTEAGYNTAIFTATVVSVHIHSVPYADVVSGVTYKLKEPDAVVKRWEHQIQALRAVA